VPGVRNRIERAYLLADPDKRPLTCSRLNEDDVAIAVGDTPDDPISTVIALEYEGAADMNPLTRLYGSDYRNVFGVFDGDVHGRKLRYDTGKRGRDNVTDWSDAGDWVGWELRAPEPGRYRLEASYAAPAEAAGGVFVVSIAGNRVAATVRATADWHDFRADEIGTVVIEAAGTYTLRVDAETIPGPALMNLRYIALDRIDG
jgi:alpha-L-fucosidase